MNELETLIKEADQLIQKESWRYSKVEADRIITLINNLFDLNSSTQENCDIEKMKQENIENAEFIALKEMTVDGKKTYTDKTAEAFLDGKYEKERIAILSNKYKGKVIDNKLLLLKEKLMLVKKYLDPNI